jgi:hypothetical protein
LLGCEKQNRGITKNDNIKSLFDWADAKRWFIKFVVSILKKIHRGEKSISIFFDFACIQFSPVLKREGGKA